MATPFSKPLEYAEYIEPVDMDLLLKAVTYKQGKYDLNKQRITNLVNQAIDMPFAKDEDREYFDSRMTGLINELNRYGAGDLSSDSRADYLVGFLSQAADESVANGVAGTLWKRQYDASAKKAREENPESFSDRNYQFGLQNYYSWLNDKQVGTDVNNYSNPWTGKGVGTYQPFVNVDAMLSEELEKIDPDITFQVSPFGNGIQYYKNKYEVITDEQILNDINLQVKSNPQLQAQLDINAWATYSQASPEELQLELEQYYQHKAEDAEKSINALNKLSAGADTEQLNIINSQIESLKKLQNTYTERSTPESINNVLSNPDAKVSTLKQIYQDDLFGAYVFRYAENNLVDMDIFADESAKINAQARASASVERNKLQSEVLKETFDALGEKNFDLAEAKMGYMDVMGFDFGWEKDANGKTIPVSGRDLVTAYQAATTQRTMQTGAVNPSYEMGVNFQMTLDAALDAQEQGYADLATLDPTWGKNGTKVYEKLVSWDTQDYNDAIDNAKSEAAKKQLEFLRDNNAEINMMAFQSDKAYEMTIEDAVVSLQQNDMFWTSPYAEEGEYLRLDKGKLWAGDAVTSYEIGKAYDLIREGKRVENIADYGKFWGTAANWGANIYYGAKKIVRAPYDGYGGGRLATGGDYTNSTEAAYVERRLQDLYDLDNTRGKELYTSVSGFLGYDFDGDGLIDFDPETNLPIAGTGSPAQNAAAAVYGEGLYNMSQRGTGQRFVEAIPEALYFMSLGVGPKVGPVVNRFRVFRRGAPITATKNYRIGQFTPGGGRATRNIKVGERIPGTGTSRTMTTLGPSTSTGRVGVLLDNILPRGGALGDVARVVTGRGGKGLSPLYSSAYTYGVKAPVISALAQTPIMGYYAATEGDPFYRRMRNESLILDNLTDPNEIVQAGDPRIADRGFIEGKSVLENEMRLAFNERYTYERDGQIFFNPASFYGDKYYYNLNYVLNQAGAEVPGTETMILNEGINAKYAPEIFRALNVTPDGQALLAQFPEFKSLESLLAWSEKDPTEDDRNIIFKVEGIGSNNLFASIQVEDEDPIVASMNLDPNSPFYVEQFAPAMTARNLQIRNMHSNLYQMEVARSTPSLRNTIDLQSLTLFDEDSGYYFRPKFSMTYAADRNITTSTKTYKGDKVLDMKGVEVLTKDKNGRYKSLGTVMNAGPYNFTETIGSTLASSGLSNPDQLYETPDSQLSQELSRRFFSDIKQVEAVLDAFEKGNFVAPSK